ncbi:hypothetical protein [Sphingorhabdus sp.]|jgi:hypothetical protein|uniref:CC0125/CC1285 family lipoprotein n=1 Tax=Sphingorhabdus sp. TaxID=1902408 RepID=UPI0025E95716|nr:hypothetical protein [Sphingorhabdus sp.]
MGNIDNGGNVMNVHLSRRRALSIAASLSAAMLLTSCMTPTPYQPEIRGKRIHGGYSEEHLGDNRYRVTFDGNMLTSRERVEGYLLYRAAELTVEKGFDWFRIVDRETERDRRTYVEPSPFYRPWYGYDYWRPSWRYYRPRYGWNNWYPYGRDPFWADEMDVRTVEEYEAHAEIIMGRGAVLHDKTVFDARKVLENLGPSIEWPKDR